MPPISSQHPDTEIMYLLVQHPERMPKVIGPFDYSFLRDMAAVSIYTSERDDLVESTMYRLDIRSNDQPIIDCFPPKFFNRHYIRRAMFRIEDGPEFLGYTDGATWNGWAMPYFPRDIAEEVLKAYPGDRDDEDAYKDYTFPDQDSIMIVNPDNGRVRQVWPIGSGAWCWDETELPKEDE